MRIICFGDSICVGQGVSIHKGWVTRVSAFLEDLSKALENELVIVNASVNGNTTRQALERMPYEVQSHGVDILLIQFGMNDCNYWESDKCLPRVSPAAFRSNLLEIIARGKVFGAKKIILNTNHPTTRTMVNMAKSQVTYQDSNELYNRIIREVTEKSTDDIVLNDIENVFFEKLRTGSIQLADCLLADELHLSSIGHDLYYDATVPIVEKLMHELSNARE